MTEVRSEFGDVRPSLPARIVPHLRSDLPLIVLDLAAVFTAYFVPLVLRFGGEVPDRYWRAFWWFVLVAALVHLGANYLFGLYGQMWRFASVQEARRLLLAVGSVAPLLVAANVLVPRTLNLLPNSTVAFGLLLSLIAFGAVRFHARLFGFRRRSVAVSDRRALVMGAGEAAAMLLKDLHEHPTGLEPVGLLDDDPRKLGLSLHGVRVLGRRSDLPRLVQLLGVDEVLLAIPSATSEVVREVSALCEESEVPMRVLPSRAEIVGGRVSARDIRDLRIEDLIGRRQVATDLAAVESMVRGRRVMVTGAGGSVGSEIARQVSAFAPASLVLLDHDETHLHDVTIDLDQTAHIVPVLADIRDRERILRVFDAHAPDVVFHAAAHKHVPVLEAYPEEAVGTNVLGTANVADAAIVHGAERFVLISTDKAVNTTNVMGATKWFAERIVRSLDGGPTIMCSVRFGNVLGSRGSVVPTFVRQIERGGPVTVTDPNMCRYFMSVGEAVQLVLQAAALSRGGEVFTLEMGEPVNILDLARRLIRLSGRVPDRDVEIRVIGRRPGEKLVEELSAPGELPEPTTAEGILVSRTPRPDPAELRASLRELENLARGGDPELLCAALKRQATEGRERAAVGGSL